MDDLLGKMAEYAWTVLGAGFAYFYKRDQEKRDREIATIQDRLTKTEHIINNRLVRRSDLKELKDDINGRMDELFEELRGLRTRIDGVMDRKGS